MPVEFFFVFLTDKLWCAGPESKLIMLVAAISAHFSGSLFQYFGDFQEKNVHPACEIALRRDAPPTIVLVLLNCSHCHCFVFAKFFESIA